MLIVLVTKSLFSFSYEMNFSIETLTETRHPNVHFIGPWYGLFFASLYCVLNHIKWCEENNKIPVVYWDSRSQYYNSQGFNGKTNVWEYYFEPVSHINLAPANRPALEFSPGGSGFNSYQLDQTSRHRIHHYLQKYVKIRPVIMKKIDKFYTENMGGRHTIAIHLRGTDKGREEKLVSPESIVSIALKYAHDDTQFLLASDEDQLMARMTQLLKGRKVIYYDCWRAPDSKPIPLIARKPKPSKGQMGEDVLVEVSLMARSNMLIHTMSNVSSAALHFNPDLEHVTVRHPSDNRPIPDLTYLVK